MKANIIAVDFDGTLCENKWPEIGMPNEELIEYLKKRQANGEKLILWTSRNEEQTKAAVEWCKEQPSGNRGSIWWKLQKDICK